jgi:hypothetical protein
MRTTVFRTLTIAATAGAVLFAGALPAQAQGEFIRLIPNTVRPGGNVTIEANCVNNTQPADVSSRAFGRVQVLPQAGTGLLSAVVTIPRDTMPSQFQVMLRCPSGATATTSLFVIDGAVPTQGPAAGGGGLADSGDTGGSGGAIISGGLVALAAAAALGLLTTRRRRGRDRRRATADGRPAADGRPPAGA